MACTRNAPARLALAVALVLVAGCAPPLEIAGLGPESPEVRRRGAGGAAAFVEVDSIRPTLRWQVFPRPEDLEADADGVYARLGDVTYDLKILTAERPIRQVYARRALPEAVHTVEEPLTPESEYLWTVRARFVLDDAPRVTPWGMIVDPRFKNLNPQRLPTLPNPHFFRFRTP